MGRGVYFKENWNPSDRVLNKEATRLIDSLRRALSAARGRMEAGGKSRSRWAGWEAIPTGTGGDGGLS